MEDQCHIPDTLPPRKQKNYPLGPRAGLDECWKSLDCSDHTKLLYSLCYPSPFSHYITFKIDTWCNFDHAMVLVAANAVFSHQAPRCGWRPTGRHGITALSNITNTQTCNLSSKTRKMHHGLSWQIIYCPGAESTEQVFKLVREVQRLASLMAANWTHDTHTHTHSAQLIICTITKGCSAATLYNQQAHISRRGTSLTRKGTNSLNSQDINQSLQHTPKVCPGI